MCTSVLRLINWNGKFEKLVEALQNLTLFNYFGVIGGL